MTLSGRCSQSKPVCQQWHNCMTQPRQLISWLCTSVQGLDPTAAGFQGSDYHPRRISHSRGGTQQSVQVSLTACLPSTHMLTVLPCRSCQMRSLPTTSPAQRSCFRGKEPKHLAWRKCAMGAHFALYGAPALRDAHHRRPLTVQEVYEQLPAAKALFDRASEVLDYDLLQACVEGAAQLSWLRETN